MWIFASGYMRSAKPAFFISCGIICLTVCSFAQDSTITGFVADSSGAAIVRAHILVHWDPSGSTVGLKDNLGLSHDLTTTTDGTGHFTAAVPPGFYDVFVSAPAFTPFATKVRVKAHASAKLELRLDVSPVVSRELADHF